MMPPAVTAILVYLVLGLAYWLCSLSAFGLPSEVGDLPPRSRRRVQVWTALLTVLLWPVALIYDMSQRFLH